jgi:P-aminobenzoate N-oxygenase AurF
MNALSPSVSLRLQAYFDLEWPLVLKRLGCLFHARRSIEGELAYIPISHATLSLVHTLLRKSYDRPLEVRTAIPWDLGIDRNSLAKALARLWLYGTPFHELLNPQQRLEVSWLEIARDVSWLIKLKECMSSLYTSYPNRYRRSIPSEVQDYLLVQSKEDIVHVLMLKRYMSMAGLPTFKHFPALERISALLPEMHPCIAIVSNLVLTWIIDAGTMDATQNTGIDIVTREIFKLHHADKVRHLDFSRRLIEDYFSDSSRDDRQRVRQILSWVIPDMLSSYRFSPEIAAHTSFEFPVNTHSTITAVRQSAQNELLDRERFQALV